MSINPPIRLLLLLTIFFAQFFTAITYVNTLAGESTQLSQIRDDNNKEYNNKSSYQDEAVKNLNDELIVKSSTETMIRVNSDELIKVRNLQPAQTANVPATQASENSKVLVSR